MNGKILVVSRYRRINPYSLEKKGIGYSLLLPKRDKKVLKYAKYYEDVDEERYEKVFEVNVNVGLPVLLKELKAIKRIGWDGIYIVNPLPDVPIQYVLLMMYFSAIPVYLVDSNYKSNRVSFTRKIWLLIKSLVLNKNVRYRFPAIVSRKLNMAYNFGKPSTVIIENTNICDQKCPICETGLGILRRKKGTMSLEKYKAIIDEVKEYVEKVSIYFMGEPLLDKTFYDKVKYTVDNKIITSIATNGNLLDVEKLFWCGLHQIDFKMSGMDESTHDKYRVGGSLEKVVEHIKVIVRERESRKSVLPYIGLGFIVMKHNEHQKDEFLEFAKTLGVDNYRLVKTCLRTVEQANSMLPIDEDFSIYDHEMLKKGLLIPKWRPHNQCGVVWHQTVISWDGNVFPCCTDAHGDYTFGNIFEEKKFGKIWNSKKMRDFRKKILIDQKSINICDLCQEFATTR